MTTTVEVKVTDGGSIDATTTKLVKLRDVKKEIESGTGKGGAAAIKSVADAAENGTAKFQKATGALQNLAAATGNPLLMKGASMFNGLAAGLNKVESGALGAASGMRALMVAGGAVLVAITAAVGALKLFSDMQLKTSTYGKYLEDTIDDVTKSTEELTKATRDYLALGDKESSNKLVEVYAESDKRLKILQFTLREIEKDTRSAFQVLMDYDKAISKSFDAWIKSFWDKGKALAQLKIAAAEDERKRDEAAFQGQGAEGSWGEPEKKDKPKGGGKTALEKSADAAKDYLGTQMKLNAAESRLAEIQEKRSTVLDMELVNRVETLAIEEATLRYAQAIIDSGGKAIDILTAQKTLEADISVAKEKSGALIDARNAKTEEARRKAEDMDARVRAAKSIADNEEKYAVQELLEFKLSAAEQLGTISVNSAIAERERIGLAKQELDYKMQIIAAEDAAAASKGAGDDPEKVEQILESTKRAIDARNASAKEGIEITAQTNIELERQRSLMENINTLGETMATVFGSVGASMGKIADSITRSSIAQANYAEQLKKVNKDTNPKEYAKILGKAKDAEIAGYQEIAGAAKNMFAEKTAAHKVAAATEKALAAYRMTLMAAQLAADMGFTTTSVANSGTRAVAAGAEGTVKAAAETPGPVWTKIAAGVAMAAFVASLVKGFSGGGGGGSAPKMPNTTGANGGVLGGSDKVSTSLVDGIDKLNENNYELLRHSRGKMYSALVAIRDNIGNFMAGVARSGLMASQTETGSSEKLFGLFGSSTSITAAGLNIRGTMGGGITTAEQYETVERKKKFLRIPIGSKSITSVQELSDSLKNDIEGIFKSMGEALVSGAEVFGSTTEAVRNAVNSVAFDLSISTKGMSTDEIMKALEAKVGTELDRAIGSVLPGFANVAKLYQEVGESSLDFLVRASYTAENVMAGLESISKTVVLGHQTTAEFAFQLSEMMGGIDKFNEQTSFYAENFLSDAERLAPVQARVTAEMAKLGLASVNTREEFKNIVQGLDLATVRGKQTYAALMELAPAFAAVYEESEKVLTVEEKLADLREKELTLKEKITQAYESESSAIKATIDSIKGSINSLVGYKSSLNTGVNSTLTPAEKYALARSEAAKVAAAAASGDSAAASKLPSVLDNLLSTSKVMNASGSGYQADFDYVQRLLDMSIGGLEGQKTDAQKQLTTLENTYSTLNIMKEQSYTMVQLMQQLADLQTEEARIVTEQETNKRAEAELKALNEAAERLRRQQEAESKEQITTLKRGFIGVITALTPRNTNTTTNQQPIINDPSYYVWNYEPTGGA